MRVTLREPRGIAEYQVIADLDALTRRERLDPEQLIADDAPRAPAGARRRAVAVGDDGRVVGTSLLSPAPWNSPGSYQLSLAVAADYRRRGLGSQLYDDALAHAPGLTELVTTLRDDQGPEGRLFAERRGFALRQHWVYWELALPSFDEAPFLPVFAQLHAQQIRFLSLAEAGNNPHNGRKLYELNRRTSLQAPGEDSFPTFEDFVQDIVRASWFQPEGQLLAADGDEWVGLVAVSVDGNRAFNAFTGVDEAYRRRGIARALTLLGIRYARQHNATYLQVCNDSRNVPMFNLQEQLGYHRIAGRCIMERQFV